MINLIKNQLLLDSGSELSHFCTDTVKKKKKKNVFVLSSLLKRPFRNKAGLSSQTDLISRHTASERRPPDWDFTVVSSHRQWLLIMVLTQIARLHQPPTVEPCHMLRSWLLVTSWQYGCLVWWTLTHRHRRQLEKGYLLCWWLDVVSVLQTKTQSKKKNIYLRGNGDFCGQFISTSQNNVRRPSVPASVTHEPPSPLHQG